MDDLFTLVADAEALYEEGLRDQGDARCREAIEGFADDADDEVAEMVDWCRMSLAHSAFERGSELHEAGHGAEAEAAYREAIAGGHDAGWLMLGILLQGAPGREAEEIEALRAAMKSDQDDVAVSAALELGSLLLYRGDGEGARACLELAVQQGDRNAAWRATGGLAFLAAGRKDRAEVEKRVRALAAASDDDVARFVPLLTRVVSGVAGARVMRRVHRVRWEAGRARRARRVWGG